MQHRLAESEGDEDADRRKKKGERSGSVSGRCSFAEAAGSAVRNGPREMALPTTPPATVARVTATRAGRGETYREEKTLNELPRETYREEKDAERNRRHAAAALGEKRLHRDRPRRC